MRTCLDAGCGPGIITDELAQHFHTIFGVDVDPAGVRWAQSHALNGAVFARGSATRLPIASGSVDIVICAQVYEHLLDKRALAAEIWRVLRPGGVCFFSGPNKYTVMEEHYWLPFLSWLPQPLADGYMRFFRKGTVYDVWPWPYWRLRQLWGAFRLQDYTVTMLRDPRRFAVAEVVGKMGWISTLPDWAFRLLLPLLPNYNWILTKPA